MKYCLLTQIACNTALTVCDCQYWWWQWSVPFCWGLDFGLAESSNTFLQIILGIRLRPCMLVGIMGTYCKAIISCQECRISTFNLNRFCPWWNRINLAIDCSSWKDARERTNSMQILVLLSAVLIKKWWIWFWSHYLGHRESSPHSSFELFYEDHHILGKQEISIIRFCHDSTISPRLNWNQ